MKNRRLNIPATLIHTMKGKLYKVNGLILSINESNDTCTMKFDNEFTSANIPMNKVLINEGFIDKIKEYGKKVANYITLKVKGFIVLVDETAKKVFPWSLYNAGNLAIEAANGQMPSGVYFAPSASLQSISGVKGMSIDEAFAQSMLNDRNEIVKYWKRVIQRSGTTDNESIEESIKYVNEHYYRTSNTYKKSLNEAIYDYRNVKDSNGLSQYGTETSSKQLKVKLKSNIRKQISGPLGGHATVKPYLIWGAPGIGKTAICKLVIKELASAKYNAINLNLQTINLNGMTIEQWTLPKDNTRTIDGVLLRNFGDTPKSWLPVYLKDSDPEVNKKRDAFFNTCRHLANNENGEILAENNLEYEGGIVFFDEYSRVEDQGVLNILMALSGNYVFGENYNVASKWGFVYAANRSIDENEADSEKLVYNPTSALSDRFTHITYVPDKEEWLEWAREIDPLTHEANVPPFICDFIETSPDYVWYSTITNGGYDDMLKDKDKDKRAHEVEEDPYSEIQRVLDMVKGTKYQMTPRKWADQIGKDYKLELIDIFGRNDEGISGKEIYNELLKKSKILKTDEEGTTYEEYYGGILPNVLIDALNNIDDEAWDSWIEDQGGEKELDPSGSFRGIKKRYNLFMSWFANMLREKMNDSTGSNWTDANSPIMHAWRNYLSFSKHFTPETINSIWETGSMPKKYQSDDNKAPLTMSEFENTEYSKWKSTTSMIFYVIDLVFNNYPGDIETDMHDDMERMANALKLTDNLVIDEANKLNDKYSFNIRSLKVELLFDDKDFSNIKLLRNKVNCLKNSIVCQRLTHFASWVAKITMQTNIGNIAETVLNNIHAKMTSTDADIFNEFSNLKLINDARYALSNDKDNDVLKANQMFEETKSPLHCSLTILKRVQSFDLNKAISVSKKRKK